MAPRLGRAIAVLIAAVLVFLGPAWEDLLWPAGISFMGAMAAGLGALLALERESRRGDLVACGLFVVSTAFSTLGLAFVVGAIADVALRRPRAARAYIPLVPIALYALWYLAYGSEVESPASIDNLLTTPLHVWDSASAAIASLTGLSGLNERSLGSSPDNGRPLLVILLALAAWGLARTPALASRRFWVLVAIALFFWISAGINETPGREPGASRYQLIGAVLVVLIGAELLRGRRLGRPWLLAAAAVVIAVILSNVGALREGERFLRARSDSNAAALAAIQGARAEISGDFIFDSSVTGSPFTEAIEAADFYAAIDRWGEPISDPIAALEGTEEARQSADSLLVAALGVAVQPEAGPAPGTCAGVPRGPPGPTRS